MTRLCLVFGFRNKEKSGSQPACLDHVQDRRALALKAHQSESHLPIGRCGGASGTRVGVWPWLQLGFSCLNKPQALRTPYLQPRGEVSRAAWLWSLYSMLYHHSSI